MRLAHLADIHLGFRRYYRETADGVNVREADVALAFVRAIRDVVAQRPGVVLFAGDVCHRVRPPNASILLLEDQLALLRRELPDATIVMIAGDHDTPKENESGFILPVAKRFGVHLALTAPLVIPVPGGSVTAVPTAAIPRMPLPPEGPGQHVLVTHGDIAGYGAPFISETKMLTTALDPDALERAGWAYVALGHYHVGGAVRPRIWYAGALEYTSTDVWAEVRKERDLGLAGKSYLLVTLGDGEPTVDVRPVGPARAHFDLEPLDATGLTVEQIDVALVERFDPIAIDGACVRLVVREIPRDFKRALNYTRIREWKTRALDLHLDCRAPSNTCTPAARQQMHKSLDDFVETLLGQRDLPPGMDRQAFVAKGMEYLKAAAATGDPYSGEQ